MNRRVLLIAGEKHMKEFSLTLRENGLDAFGTTTPEDGLRAFYSFRPSLVLLDMDIPQFDGWKMCERIRDLAETPIIVMSDRSERDDLLRGYEVGVDSYILKPVDKRDLVQRIYGTLRRKSSTNGDVQVPPPFESGNLTIDWSSNEVQVNGTNLTLTPTEFKLLGYLAQNKGRTLTHEQILSRVWGPEYISDKSYVKLYIRYLRQKIEEDPSKPRCIVTQRGFGYKFVA